MQHTYLRSAMEGLEIQILLRLRGIMVAANWS
jgi:hypothetical protein